MAATKAQQAITAIEEINAHAQYAEEELIQLERRATTDETRALIHKLIYRQQIIQDLARQVRRERRG